MSAQREIYTLEMPADLAASREAIGAVLAWLQLQGHTPETTRAWRLPITEAVTNAIRHGCRGRSGARIAISAYVNPAGTEVNVRDPGSYEPTADAALLGDDPLAENGRGGFLIAQTTDRSEHRNDPLGHTLSLHWNQRPATRPTLAAAANAHRTIDQLAEKLGDAYESITAYTEFAGLLATTSDFAELRTQVLRRLAQAVVHESCVLRFFEGEALVLSQPVPGDPTSIPTASATLEIRTGAERNCVALASPADLPPSDPLRAAAGPVVIVAVGCPQRCRGTLAVVRAKYAPAFTAGQIAFVQAVADFLGTTQSLSDSWRRRTEQVRLEQELQLAARIQQQLFPQVPPPIAGWSVTGRCRPSLAMGGDYFDWIAREDGTCLVLVADVMGKGMPAAMVATMLRSTWRALAVRRDTPGRLLTDLNAQLVADLATLEVFITAVLVQLSPHDGRVQYANAGHCALLQGLGPKHDFYQHTHGGPPLGINPLAQFEAAEFTLARGNSLFAFTDGCYEIDRSKGSAVGFENLELELRNASDLPPDEVVATVLHRLQNHATGDLPDDCTLVAMRLLP